MDGYNPIVDETLMEHLVQVFYAAYRGGIVGGTKYQIKAVIKEYNRRMEEINGTKQPDS